MQYGSKTEPSDQKHGLEIAAELEKFLEGDNKALVKMLKEADITRTDVQQTELVFEQ